MRRIVKVRLSRQVRGKGKKTSTRSIVVPVYQATLGGFIEALRVAGEYVLRFRQEVRKGQDLTAHDVVMALAHPVVCSGIADVLCPGMPRGWFEPWHSQKNIERMLDGARKTSDWGRLVAQLDLAPGAEATGAPAAGKAPRRRGGSLYSDAIAVARILGVNPAELIDEWPMERFLDVVDGLIRGKEAADEERLLDDPTMDPHAKPTPLIPGLGKQWVN